MKIFVDRDFDLKSTIEFCNQVFELPSESEYIFDFNDLGWMTPFSMLYLSSQIGRFRKGKKDAKFYAVNHEKHPYPAHMGFFTSFGVNYGKKPGEADGSSRYLPITIITAKEIRDKANGLEEFGETIERISRQLSQLLTQQDDGDLIDILTYSFREVFRNVYEHSQSNLLEYCAQYWPSKQQVELAILDRGVGIMSTLKRNPYLRIVCDHDALNYCLLPGISGKMYKGKKQDPNNVWQNSGYGLYMINRLCRNGGSFFICSGSAGIEFENGSKKEFEANFPGTALRLKIDTARVQSISNMLNQFRDEGYEIAKELSASASISASTASTMLGKDFKEP